MDNLTPKKGLPLTRDQSFFFSIVVVGVDDSLFSVPRELLQVPGSYFAAILSPPSIGATATPGTSIDNPLVIKGVSKDVFKSLLRCLCPSLSGEKKLAKDQLSDALKLATMWNMQNARTKVSSMLYPILSGDPTKDFNRCIRFLDQVVWGHDHKVKEWFYRGLLYFITSDPTYSWSSVAPECQRLIEKGISPHTLVKLMGFREYYLMHRFNGYENTGTTRELMSDPMNTQPQCGSCQKMQRGLYKGLGLRDAIDAYIPLYFGAEMTTTLDIQKTYCTPCVEAAMLVSL